MTARQVEVGSILKLCRENVQLDPIRPYTLIGVYSWGKGIFHRENILGADAGSLKFFRPPADALLLSNIQAWEGAIAVTSRLDADCVASSRFLPYTAKDPDQVDVNYLLHYFLSTAGMRQINRASPGTQVRNRTLGISAFERIRVHLPDLSTQKAIAKRIMEADQVAARSICGALRLNAACASMRDALLAGTTTRRPLAHFVRRASADMQVQADHVYDLAGMLNRGRGFLSRGRIRGSETQYRTLSQLHSGHLVYSKLKGWEGSVAVVPPEFDGFFVSPEFPVFEILDPSRVSFVAHVVRSHHFVAQMAASVSGMGQRRQRVNPEQFLAIEVPDPDPRERAEITEHLDRIETAAQSVARRQRLASALVSATRNAEFEALLG